MPMHYQKILSPDFEPTPALHARADELLHDAPPPYLIDIWDMRLVPCIVSLCGLEFFGAELHGPRPGPFLAMPGFGGYEFGFMRARDLRQYCRREFQMDPAKLPPPPVRTPGLLERLVYAQLGKPRELQRQGWADYLRREPRSDAIELYRAAFAGTAILIDDAMQQGLDRSDGPCEYHIRINHPLISHGLDCWMEEAEQTRLLTEFATRCKGQPKPRYRDFQPGRYL